MKATIRSTSFIALIVLICAFAFVSCDEEPLFSVDGTMSNIPEGTPSTDTNTPESDSPETNAPETDSTETGVHTHSFRTWSTVTAATCTEAGSEESTCSCGVKETRTVNAKGHTEAIDEAVASTCSKEGLTEGKHCSVCNEVIISQMFTPKAPHTYDNDEDASCNECGVVRDINCEHLNRVVFPAVEPTCTEAGYTKGESCAHCGEIFVVQTAVNAKGHTAETDHALSPTCTETGLTEGKHCSVCNEVLIAQSVVNAKGHTAVTDPAIEASCTESGYTEGKHCSECGEVLVAQTEIAANGHTEVIDKAVSPTCTETGLTEGKHCSVCNEVLTAQRVLDAKGHAEGEWVTDKPATNTEDGKKHVNCSVCGQLIKEEIIYAGSVGLAYVANHDGSTCTVTGIGTCTDTDIVIPKYIDGYLVNAIGENAFKGKNIKSITFGSNIRDISCFVFTDCELLSKVYFTGTLEEWLRIDRLGKGSSPMCNGADLYIGGELVEHLVIPGSVKTIDECAFAGCSSLISVTISDGVENIGADAFYDCSSLKKVTLPSCLTKLYSKMIVDIATGSTRGAFEKCPNLTSVYYNGTLAQWCAIDFCYNNANPLSNGADLYIGGSLVVDLVIPSSVSKVKDVAFYGCTSIKSVTVGSNIGAGAFCNCSAIESVTLSGDISLDYSTFASCSSITDVNFAGGNITMIGYSFAHCTALKSINFSNCNVTLGECAFYGCTALETLVLSEGLTEIPYYAFSKCTSLKSVTIGGNIEIVGTSAFEGCTALTDVTIESGVKKLYSSVFTDCTSLKSIVIPDSVTDLGGYAFDGCTALESITISKNIKSFGGCTFLGCSNLKSVYYTGTLSDWCKISIFQSVSASAPLYNGTDLYIQGQLLVNLVVPSDITKIEGYAFNGCTSIKTITVHSGVTAIGNGAFDCDNLESMVIENATGIFWTNVLLNARNVVKTIHVKSGAVNYGAFWGCTALESIVLDSGVTSIDSDSFMACTSLKSIVIPEGVTRIEEDTFYGCTSLESLTLPSTITNIDLPFDKCSKFSITYNGTIDQWNAITKEGNLWWKNISIVHCNDGDTEPYSY